MNIKNNKKGENKQRRACEGGENIGVVSHTKNWNKRALEREMALILKTKTWRKKWWGTWERTEKEKGRTNCLPEPVVGEFKDIGRRRNWKKDGGGCGVLKRPKIGPLLFFNLFLMQSLRFMTGWLCCDVKYWHYPCWLTASYFHAKFQLPVCPHRPLTWPPTGTRTK